MKENREKIIQIESVEEYEDYCIKKDEKYIKDLKEKYERKEHRQMITRRVVRFAVFFFILLAGLAIFYISYLIARDIPVNKNDKKVIEITVTEGMTREDVEAVLLENGLISDTTLFKIREKLFKADYQTGTYRLKRSFNNEKIINILSGIEYPN